MLDLFTTRGRVVDAALRLAERRPWREVSLADIAREAGVTLIDMRAEFQSKADILAAFTRAADDEVLRRSQLHTDASESARDRLFGVLMTRFDVLQPRRAALKSIVADASLGGGLASLKPMLASLNWMMAAAGVPAEGLGGAARIAGLATVYARAFREWLDDDDPGLARTMAVLDRRLRNGERWLQSFDEACAGLGRFAEAFKRRRARPGEPREGASPAGAPATAEGGAAQPGQV